MKSTVLTIILGAALSVSLCGCQTPTTRIVVGADNGGEVAAIDYRDVQEAAGKLIRSLLGSGRLARADGGVYVLTVGRIKNDTMQRFDTDILTGYITESLMNSGSVMITSAMSATEDNRDEMVDAVRSIREDAEFNQSTVVGSGQKIAPTHSVYGKIIQRDIRMDNGDKQIEYYFQLRIVELATGLQWWQKQEFIGKRTDGRNRTW